MSGGLVALLDDVAALAKVAAIVADPVEVQGSQVREEYRGSGQWRSDAPSAITGR